MIFQSLKKYLKDNSSFFCWDNPNFDMSFLLNVSYDCEVIVEGYVYPIRTPNIFFMDVRLDDSVRSLDDIHDETLINNLTEYAAILYQSFPIHIIPDYMFESVNFFKQLRIGLSLVKTRTLDSEQIKNVVTIELDENGENIWAIDKLCAILPEDIEVNCTHRLIFRLMHTQQGIIDFDLDTFDPEKYDAHKHLPPAEPFTIV